MKKLQVIFKEDVADRIDQINGFVNIEKIASVYYIITDRYGKDLIDDLQELGATSIESIGLTLEEIFIYTNKNQSGGEINE